LETEFRADCRKSNGIVTNESIARGDGRGRKGGGALPVRAGGGGDGGVRVRGRHRSRRINQPTAAQIRAETRRAGIGAGSETGRRITDRGERSSSSERGAERGPASQSVAALPGWAHLSVAYECRAGKVGLLGLISMGQAILGCGLPLMMGCFPSSIFFVAGDRTGQDRATSRSVLEEEKHSILFFPFSFVKLAR
jgi:hypothetical protein